MSSIDLVDKFRKANPYPTDIFPPLSQEEIKAYVKLLIDNGFSSDRIHAHWMRHTWMNATTKLMELQEETTEMCHCDDCLYWYNPEHDKEVSR